LEEIQSNKYHFCSLWFEPTRFKPTIYHTRGYALNMTPLNQEINHWYHHILFIETIMKWKLQVLEDSQIWMMQVRAF